MSILTFKNKFNIFLSTGNELKSATSIKIKFNLNFKFHLIKYPNEIKIGIV